MENKKQYRILAVDDAPDTLMLLEFDLVEEGYQVFCVESSEQALEILGQQSIDLILLDMYMPGLSGLALLQKLKAETQYKNIPIIMLSASDEEDQIVAALEFGADDYVTKPYLAKVLLARIRTSLRLFEKTQALEKLANTDFLTNLNNRGSYENLTKKAISMTKRQQLSLVIAALDIDFFKQINDNYGHDAGDKVLQEFAILMGDCFRGYDILGRVGGEEFSVCMPDTSIGDAEIACERFRTRLANTDIMLNNENNDAINITVSIGIAKINEMDCYYEDLMRVADSALYQAKNNGRNQTWQTPSPSNDPLVDNSLRVESAQQIADKFPGIDYEVGVANVLGDDDLFNEILLMFYEDHQFDSEKIAQAIASKDQKACKYLVHTLKGVACSVGAMHLFTLTKQLDIVINNEEFTRYSRLFEPVGSELNKIIHGIARKLIPS